jgi:hypothetical protein
VTLLEEIKTTQGQVYQHQEGCSGHWVENDGDQASTTVSSTDGSLALDAALCMADVDIPL